MSVRPSVWSGLSAALFIGVGLLLPSDRAAAATPAPAPTATPTPKPKLSGGFGRTPVRRDGGRRPVLRRRRARGGRGSRAQGPETRRDHERNPRQGSQEGKAQHLEDAGLSHARPGVGPRGDDRRLAPQCPAAAAGTPAPAPAALPRRTRPSGKSGHTGPQTRGRSSSPETASLEPETKQLENDFYRWDDGQYRDRVIKPAWDKPRARSSDGSAQLVQAEKDLADLPEKARVAGAMPGWMRE